MKQAKENIVVTCRSGIDWQVEVSYYIGYKEECDLSAVWNMLGNDISSYITKDKFEELERLAQEYMQDSSIDDDKYDILEDRKNMML